MVLRTRKIVITGGPSTGKTTVVNALEQKGFICLHEVIRTMTLAEKELDIATEFKTNPIVSVSDPMAFNRKVLNARLKQYTTSEKSDEEIVFFDRGIPDVLAYMDCFGQEYGSEFIEACISNPYDLIFLMPPWQQIHISDNERFENFEESLRVNDCLLKRYLAFDYEVVIVPKGSVSERVDFILNSLKIFM